MDNPPPESAQPEPAPSEPAPVLPPAVRPAKWKVTVVIASIVAIQIGNWIATAWLAGFAIRHPMWLVLLQPTTKNLLLVYTEIPLITFFVVAILRRQLPHPLWFLIGRWYGNNGIEWVKKRVPDVGILVTAIEDWFPKWGGLICLVYPHPIVCAMAGASKMKFRWFMVYTFIGIILWVWAARAFGNWLSPITKWMLHFGQHYFIPITIFTVATTAISIWIGFRNGRIESVGEMEADLEGDSDK